MCYMLLNLINISVLQIVELFTELFLKILNIIIVRNTLKYHNISLWGIFIGCV